MVEGLLGRPAIEKLQLVTVAQVGEAHSRPQEAFPELFRGLGRLEGASSPHQAQRWSNPAELATPRRVALPLMEAVKRELLWMEEKCVITRGKEATDWCE